MSDQPIEESDNGSSAFEAFLADHFGSRLKPEFSGVVGPLGVFLCFVNRSGSNLLAECLASSGEFPRGREFFLRSNILRHPESGSGLSQVFEAIVRKHSLNGVFAAKLGYSQLSFFDDAGFLDAAFGRTKFLLLQRRDILAQAISLEVASQNRQWTSGDSRCEAPRPEYSRKRLELKMNGIRIKYERFDEFFARHSLERLRIFYEDLVDRPAETIAAAAEFLKRPLRFVPEKVSSARSCTDLKETWRQRFLAGD